MIFKKRILWVPILKEISILLWRSKYLNFWKSVQENKYLNKSVTTINYFNNDVIPSLMLLILLDCNILTRFQISMALKNLIRWCNYILISLILVFFERCGLDLMQFHADCITFLSLLTLEFFHLEKIKVVKLMLNTQIKNWNNKLHLENKNIFSTYSSFFLFNNLSQTNFEEQKLIGNFKVS